MKAHNLKTGTATQIHTYISMYISEHIYIYPCIYMYPCICFYVGRSHIDLQLRLLGVMARDAAMEGDGGV